MSATAQKKDINDPDVIKEFADTVTSVDRLNYLYLLTVADIRATNNNLWNGWRDSLLRQLYRASKQYLEHNEKIAQNTEEKSKQRWQQALQQLIYQSWPEQQVMELWQHYESDYFLRHTTDDIVWQTTYRLRHPEEATLINTRKYDQENTLEIFICTKDRPRVFAATTACLEQLQLDILDAKINSTSDGSTLNTYIVNGPIQDQTVIIGTLENRLTNLEETHSSNPVLTPRKMKLFETKATIHFQTNEQQHHTVMELNIHDHPGLLSTIAQVFLQCDIHLINAKLATLGDQVEDIFLISTHENEPLSSAKQDQLQKALSTELSQ